MHSEIERILILCKTYPSPSARYVETSCVAGITEGGAMRRLYPVPFRLIEDDKQFRKWQWIRARVKRAADDARPESHRILIDTIEVEGDPIPTSDHWSRRREWLARIPTFDDFAAAQDARERSGVSLAIVRPSSLQALDVTKAHQADWTDDERANLMQAQAQGNLFEETEAPALRLLRKLPFDFHYRYTCAPQKAVHEYRHKIVDWEAGALYWRMRREHGDDWEPPFRAKLFEDLGEKDLMFLMGTIHRFPDQWLIVSLIYPPKPPSEAERQGQLL